MSEALDRSSADAGASFYNVGFYGVPNIGDELLCETISRRLRSKHHAQRVHVMTHDPEVTARYAKVDVEAVQGFFPTPEYFRHSVRRLRTILRSDLVIVGGGGLLADYYRWYSVPRNTIDLCCAILFNRPYVFVGLGVESIRRAWLRPLTRFALRHAAWVYCRDEDSAQRVREFCGPMNGRLEVGPDVANIDLPRQLASPDPQGYALVNLRAKPPLDPVKVRQMCEPLIERFGKIILLSAESDDTTFYRYLVKDWPSEMRSVASIVEPRSLHEVIAFVRGANVVAAERLHLNIITAHAGVPLLTMEYRSKVEQFAAMLGPSSLRCSLDEVGAEVAHRLLESATPVCRQRLAQLSEAAGACFDRAVEEGLSAGRFRWGTRFKAVCFIVVLWSVGGLYAAGVLVKRAIFGRG